MSGRTILMTGVIGLALATTLAACSSSSAKTSTGSGGSGTTTTTTINVGTSGATGAYGPLYVGLQQKVFEKYGLNVKAQTLTPNSVTAAVLAGNIDIAFDGPNLVAGILSNPSAHIQASAGPTVFYIFAKKGITSLQQLKGKTIAVTTPGGSLDTAVKAAIAKAGMKPGSDIKIAYLQTNSAALAATETGSVQAAGVSPPTSVQAQQAGLVNIGNITQFSPLGLMAVNDKFSQSQGPALLKFMQAFKAASDLAIANNADSDAAIKQYVKITDQAQLDGTWQGYRQVWTISPYPDAGMEAVLQGLANANPPVKGAANADLTKIIDNQYISQVK